MGKDSIMEQLMAVRTDKVLNGIVENDAMYLDTKNEAAGYYVQLESMHLSEDVMQLIDRYVSAQVSNGTRYGEIAYMLGFSDCTELLSGRIPFPRAWNCAGIV